MRIGHSLAIWLLTLVISQSAITTALAQTAPWDIEKLPSSKAPAFSLPDLKGRTNTNATFRGQVLLINFWATWCAPCREEMPALDRLQKQFEGKGLAVISISVDSEQSVIKEFIKGAKTQFPILHDPEMKCHDEYKVFAYPTTFLVDRQGVIQRYWIGPQEWESEEFKQILQSYLP